MSARQFIKWAAIIAGVIAVISLMLPVSAIEAGPFGTQIPVDCGSALDSSTAACADAVDTRKAWTVPLMFTALGVFLAAVLIHPQRPSSQATRPEGAV